MIINLLQSTGVDNDSLALVSKMEDFTGNLASGDMRWEQVLSQLITWALDAGKHILIAAVVYLVGHYLIKLLNYLVARFLERRDIEVSVQTFVKSFLDIVLQVLLIVTVVGALGINTTSFAALLASFGVAIGMALSGNLQNFAGGIVILFLKPYKVGDWIEAQGTGGTVQAIQIFHTILLTADGKQIYVPNGQMSSGSITNYTHTPTRMTEWVVGIEYGEDVDRARKVVLELLATDERVLKDPAPVVWLKELNSSSVDLVVRAWVINENYWGVMFTMREKIYNAFNQAGIGFPFPQLTLHQA